MLHTNAKSPKKIVGEAELSGELLLSNRKLKDLAICSVEHDLSDVTHVDCSYNCLHEVPFEMCEWYCMKTVLLSHNLIKSIPDSLSSACLIEVLDLSNNTITHLPQSIQKLKHLVILQLQNNKIVSLPAVISNLSNCEKLDVSGNEVNNLPPELGNMKSLKHLDVSRNCLKTLPDEIFQVNLVYFDASSNKISVLPNCFKRIEAVKNLILHDNPLTSPPLKVLRKGKIHMLKSMQTESLKNKRQQEIMEPLLVRKRETLSNKALDILADAVQTIQSQNINENDTTTYETIVNDQVSAKVNSEEVNANAADEPTTNDENKDKKYEETNHVEPEKEIKVVHKSPVKKVSPVKSPPPKITSPVIKKIDSDVKAKARIFDFPGYTPPLIKEKPRIKRVSRIYPQTPDQAHYLEVIKPRTAYISRKKNLDVGGEDLSFTMRRKTEKIYEELELLEQLRGCIESTLKMPLPQDLLPALTDGVILCHLANHVKSRSIPTIHVPSPAVPKLSMAKCRRNIDNFLDACSKLGVAESQLCSVNDLMHGKGLSRIVSTVKELLKQINNSSANADSAFTSPSVCIAPSSPSIYKNQLTSPT